MIAVIDYGMGNLGSVSKALEYLGGDVVVTQKSSDLKKADKIVLPGVGAFRDAMDSLGRLNLIGPLKEEIAAGDRRKSRRGDRLVPRSPERSEGSEVEGRKSREVPNVAREATCGERSRTKSRGKIYLGICLGLELLFEKSEEGGGSEGLGILKGDVVRFRGAGLKVPQIGWNQLNLTNDDCPLLQGIDSNTFFYFVHSYYVRPKDTSAIAAVTEYGGEFASMVWKENIYAVQFHPEKSQQAGLRFLENFMRL